MCVSRRGFSFRLRASTRACTHAPAAVAAGCAARAAGGGDGWREGHCLPPCSPKFLCLALNARSFLDFWRRRRWLCGLRSRCRAQKARQRQVQQRRRIRRRSAVRVLTEHCRQMSLFKGPGIAAALEQPTNSLGRSVRIAEPHFPSQ